MPGGYIPRLEIMERETDVRLLGMDFFLFLSCLSIGFNVFCEEKVIAPEGYSQILKSRIVYPDAASRLLIISIPAAGSPVTTV